MARFPDFEGGEIESYKMNLLTDDNNILDMMTPSQYL